MIEINIKVSNVEDFLELITIFKQYKINFVSDIKYHSAKHTILREQQRQTKIIDLLKENDSMNSVELFRHIKKKDRCMYKSILRDIYILFRQGVIDYNKLSDNYKFGNIYEVKLKCNN